MIRPAAVILIVWLAGALVLAQDPAYRVSVEKWRQQHEAGLRADDGWLTVVGLSWLKRGTNSAGSDARSDVALPRSAPARVGVFGFDGARVTFEPAVGAGVKVNGRIVKNVEMRWGGTPDVATVGSITMFVIQRGDRYGIRMKDANSEARRAYTGLRWFPVDEQYRIVAKFVPYRPARSIPISNVLGDQQQMTCPGYVAFVLGGREYRLEPVVESPGARELFFIFRDATSGTETYPAGRFLYTALPQNGELVLDFNKAENPPCAFTAFATCPLPPQQNWLPVRVPAGEQYTHR
jgi:uncharacterized protein (DUF1684 family)